MSGAWDEKTDIMTLLIQITDTHILSRGELLYGQTDTAAHLRQAVEEINSMQPVPDLVLITGDLVERNEQDCYEHFIELIAPLKVPAYVIPGNHDYPEEMAKAFSGTPYFPAELPSYQYAIDDFPFRILALNSHADDSELPVFCQDRLEWLKAELGKPDKSDKPILIAIHHPPMKTGIEFMDMGGMDWFQGLRMAIEACPQVKLVICGHCHTDLTGHIGHAAVYMAGATAHLLIAARGYDVAPASVNVAAAPVLHHFLEGEFLSGSYPWPATVEETRIDKASGIEWGALKTIMRGSLK
jgi:predicted phosphohydrolase